MNTQTLGQLGTDFKTLCGLLLSLSIILPAKASEPVAVELGANGTTAVFIRVDTAQLDLPPQVLDTLRNNPTLVSLASKIEQPMGQLKQNLDGQELYLAADIPVNRSWLQARIVAPSGVPQTRIQSASELLWQTMHVAPFAEAQGFRAYALSSSNEPRTQDRLNSSLPVAIKQWESAFEETSKFPVQLCVVPPEYFKKTIQEIDPELPKLFGGGSAAALISKTRWVSFGLRPKDMTLRVVVETDSTATATHIKNRVPTIISALLKSAELDQAATSMALGILGLLQPKVEGSQLIYSAEDPSMTGALLQLAVSTVAATAEPLSYLETKNKLRQQLLGIHNYESAFRALPTYKDIRKDNQKSGLSWRVHILPFIEEVELYNQFKFDEPWDSEHNKALLSQMPAVYKPVKPFGSEENFPDFHTTFVSPMGNATIFGQEEAIGFGDILDGLSNTIAIVEVAAENAVPWTAPDGHKYSVESPAAGLRTIGGKVSVGLMDGRVQQLDAMLDSAIWNALFTRDGREVIDMR